MKLITKVVIVIVVLALLAGVWFVGIPYWQQ